MAIPIVLALILILLLWVLFAPLSLRIDSYLGQYYLRWWGIGSAEVQFVPEDIVLHLRAGPWSKDFYPLHPSKKAEGGKKAKTPKKKRSRKISLHKIRRILKSFTIKEFQLEVDTDDYVWNAWLFPLCYAIRPLRHHVLVNFQGKNEIRLLIKTQAWKVAWAALF